MRILSVTPYYEPEGGGLERYTHEILRRLVARGHEVRVFASTRSVPRHEQRGGVDVHRRAPGFFLGNSPIDPGLPGALKDAIRSYRPDVVVAHTPVPYPAEMAYRAARSQGVPFVPTYHAGNLRGSSPMLDGLARLDRWTLQRSMLNGSASLIAVGPYVREHALRRHRERVTIVPPGVDTKRFKPGTGPVHPQRVLFVGPLAEEYRWKGVDVLWDAFKRVQKRFPDAELTLVGEGPRREGLLRKAAREGVRLRAPGRLGLEGLVAEYRQAGLTVLPSTTDAESFGMVLAEANACGRPVVASRVGGIPDFVRHRDNGLLVRPGDPQDLADRVTQLFLDPDEASRMGEQGRRRVVKEHDWDRLARRTERVLVEASQGVEGPQAPRLNAAVSR